MNVDQAAMIETANQESELQFTLFTNADAWEIGNLMVEAAKARSLAITIDISRSNQQLFHYAMPGTNPDNDEWIKRKNRVVGRFFHSSFYMGCYYRNLNTTIEKNSLLAESEFAPHGGAFPLTIKGVGIVGTFTVSGLPQKDDHDFVVSVLRQYFAGKSGGNEKE